MGKKVCYIVPGKVDEYDYKVSATLSIPIMCGGPDIINQLQTKSGAKDLFKELDIPVPIGKTHIKTEVEFFEELSKLVAQNLYIPGWLFKIDNEYSGRGHAWI